MRMFVQFLCRSTLIFCVSEHAGLCAELRIELGHKKLFENV